MNPISLGYSEHHMRCPNHWLSPIFTRVAEHSGGAVENVYTGPPVDVGCASWRPECRILGTERNRSYIGQSEQPLRMLERSPIRRCVDSTGNSQETGAHENRQWIVLGERWKRRYFVSAREMLDSCHPSIVDHPSVGGDRAPDPIPPRRETGPSNRLRTTRSGWARWRR
jgi:hypothetical protein